MSNFYGKNRGGTMILITVLILTSIVGVTVIASETIRLGIIAGRTQADATKAFFAAEAGAERALWELRKNSDTITCLDPQKKLCFNAYPSGALNKTGSNVNCVNIAEPCTNLVGAVDERQQITSSLSDYVIWATTSAPDNITIKSRGYNRDTRRVVELSF